MPNARRAGQRGQSSNRGCWEGFHRTYFFNLKGNIYLLTQHFFFLLPYSYFFPNFACLKIIPHLSLCM